MRDEELQKHLNSLNAGIISPRRFKELTGRWPSHPSIGKVGDKYTQPQLRRMASGTVRNEAIAAQMNRQYSRNEEARINRQNPLKLECDPEARRYEPYDTPEDARAAEIKAEAFCQERGWVFARRKTGTFAFIRFIVHPTEKYEASDGSLHPLILGQETFFV
jgi:hypothetical protein